MHRFLIPVLAVLPLPAFAQGFESAAAELQYQNYDDDGGFDVDSLEGYLDSAWMFGTFGAQVGLTLGKEIDSSADIDFKQYNGLTVHAITDLSDTVRLGAMVLADNDADGIALYAAEALYLNGPLRVEGRIGDSFDNDDPFGLAEVQGTFAIGSAFSARAGLHYTDYDAEGYYRVFSLGAGYRISDGSELYVDLGRHTNSSGGSRPTVDGSLLNLGIRFDLGGSGQERLFTYQPLN